MPSTRLVDLSRRSWAFIAVLIAGSWMLAPILRSAYVADDIPNSQRSAWLSYAHESVWSYTVRLTKQWMTNEGRFFPVSVLENTLLFHNVHSRFVYKGLQIASVLIVMGVLMQFTTRIVANWNFGILVGVVFIAAVQVRTWYDPVLSFGLLLPSATIKVLGALLLVNLGIQTTRRMIEIMSFTLAGLVWFAALFQYEVVLLLAWIPIGILLITKTSERRKWFGAVGCLMFPSLTAIFISRVVRSGVTPSPAYTTNSHVPAVLRALRFQLEGALPLSVPVAGVDARPRITESLQLLRPFGVVVGIMFALVIIHILRNLSALNWRQRGILTIMGLSFWVFPAVPTALSVRWQGELGRGNAYLPVFIQIIGVAFIGALVVETMTSVSKALTHFPRLRICVAGTLSLALTTVVIVNHAGANFAVNFYAGFRTDRELFETAVQSGLMNEVHDGATILSPLSDQNLWTNGVYVWWLGGPKGLNFVKPEEASTCSSQSVAWCSDSTSFTLVQAVVEDQPALVLLKVRGIPQLETNWDDVVDAWVYSRARPDSSCRSESKSHNGSASVWECAPSLALGHTLLMIS